MTTNQIRELVWELAAIALGILTLSQAFEAFSKVRYYRLGFVAFVSVIVPIGCMVLVTWLAFIYRRHYRQKAAQDPEDTPQIQIPVGGILRVVLVLLGLLLVVQGLEVLPQMVAIVLAGGVREVYHSLGDVLYDVAEPLTRIVVGAVLMFCTSLVSMWLKRLGLSPGSGSSPGTGSTPAAGG